MIVTAAAVVTGWVVIGNVTVIVPASTVTETGTEAAMVLLLTRHNGTACWSGDAERHRPRAAGAAGHGSGIQCH